jgi:hypothetical protein
MYFAAPEEKWRYATKLPDKSTTAKTRIAPAIRLGLKSLIANEIMLNPTGIMSSSA